jgi:hypothetical protein
MTTEDQEPIRGHGKSKFRDAGLRDSVAKEWDGARRCRTMCRKKRF